MRRTENLSLTLVVLALLAGCAAGGPPDSADDAAAAVDKAGGSGGTVVLTMGTEGRPGRPDAEQILHFARQVAERSDGRIQIEPVWSVAGFEIDADPVGYPGWDQLVAHAVVAGDLDLANVPARAWDTEGVTSLRALTAPLLLTSEELVAEVVSSDLADGLLAGLQDVGVVGVGLPPEGLRRLFAFGNPPASATPWAGGIVRAPRSSTTYAFLEALGGEPDDLPGGGRDRFEDGVRDGTVLAAESSFEFAGTLPGPVTALGGAPLFPKVNTLVANADAFGSLAEADQQVVRDAAAATVAWAIETMPNESEDARVFCERSSIAPGIPTVDLEEAAARVEDELREDPATATLIDAIRELAGELGVTPTSIEPCDPPGTDESTAEGDVDVDDQGVFPEGVYRVEHTTESLVAAGIDRPTAADHAGLWTLRFDGGRLSADDVNEHTGERIEDGGVYCVDDGRVLLGFAEFGDPPTCGNFWTAAWEFDGEELWFRDLESAIGDQELLEALFAGEPWRRIG
jgi:TRAP-type C4-dicarboxylate transport system substrate-binding protein